MNYERYQLFIAKIERLAPFTLLSSDRNSNEAIIEAGVKNFQITEVRANQRWVIGDFTDLGDGDIMFNFGRILLNEAHGYNENTKSFEAWLRQDAKIARVFANIPAQVFGISVLGNQQIKPRTVAKNLCRVFEQTGIAKSEKAIFHLVEKRDSRTFSEQLRQAHSVSKFNFKLTNPNPPLFKPSMFDNFKHYGTTINGSGLSVTATGNALNVDAIEEVAEAASQYGDEANATVKDANGNSTPISNQNSSLTLNLPEPQQNSDQEEQAVWGKECVKKIKSASENSENKN